MSALLTTLLAGLGRRFAYWGAIVAAVGVAIWLLLRRGKHAAEADLAIRRADARVRALQTSKDTHGADGGCGHELDSDCNDGLRQ